MTYFFMIIFSSNARIFYSLNNKSHFSNKLCPGRKRVFNFLNMHFPFPILTFPRIRLHNRIPCRDTLLKITNRLVLTSPVQQQKKPDNQNCHNENQKNYFMFFIFHSNPQHNKIMTNYLYLLLPLNTQFNINPFPTRYLNFL